jgi:hypothetical protein
LSHYLCGKNHEIRPGIKRSVDFIANRKNNYRNMKYLAIIIAILFVLPVYGQRKKKDDEALDSATPVYVEGIVYTLPRTVVRVKVSAIKESFQPGPYAEYAEQMLGISNVRKSAETNWIIDDIKIETYSEADPDQVHKAMGEIAMLLNLSENGCIAGINTAETDEHAEEIKTNRVGQVHEFDKGNKFSYFTDTPFYTPGDSSNNFRPIRIGSEQKMAEAAKRVLDSRRFQYDIASGMMDEFHPDGEAYKVSLKELKKTEEDYTSLFVGKSKYQKGTFSFDYVPGKTPGKAEVLFRISNENGIVPSNDLSGRPVMIEFETDKNLVQKFTDGAKSENPNAGESGVYYRMPGQATIKIINDLNVIATTRATIAQFGEIAPVPEDVLYGDFEIRFHSETGAIKSIIRK